MSRHILVVEPDAAYAARFPDADPETRWWIECPEGNDCAGWQECREPHVVDSKDAADGPHETECRCVNGLECEVPWCGEDVFTFHGIEHEWRWGYGWTVPFTGCVLAANADRFDPPDDLWQTDGTLSIGRWVVDDDWDDDLPTVTLIGPEEATDDRP